MIDATASLEAAGRILVPQLVAYLRATGWKQVAPQKGAQVFSIEFPEADQPIILPLPSGGGVEDERLRIADALQTLAVLEERNVVDIARDIEEDRRTARPDQPMVQSVGDTEVEVVSVRSGRPISDIDGLSAQAASKLKSLGIRTTGALLEAARTVRGRKVLSANTGIDEQQLLEWANYSDYMRIAGMGKAKVELLRAAGVTTVRELALRNPARLAKAIKEVNERRKAVRVPPSEKSVEKLIQQARKLPPKIIY